MIEMENEQGTKSLKYRIVWLAFMGIFLIFILIWGVCCLIRDINTNKITTPEMVSEKVVDNKKNAGKTIDVDQLITTVRQKVTFDTELNPVDDSVAAGMIATAEGTKLKMYMGDGTSADELTVITAKSTQDAKENQKNAKAHLQEMQKSFQDYIPQEAKKIQQAVIIRCGSYVVVCVTSDSDRAKEVLKEFLKG